MLDLESPMEGDGGVEPRIKKLMLIAPLIFMLVNTMVQIKEVSDKIATSTFGGFEEYGVTETMVPTPADQRDFKSIRNLQVDSQPSGDDVHFTAYFYNRASQYLYNKYGAASSLDQQSYACTQTFIDAFNNNLVSEYDMRSCSSGGIKATTVLCSTTWHPAYIGITAIWLIYLLIYIGTVAGYCWFSFSAYDFRFYVSCVKFKHSHRNRVLLGAGVILTFLTGALAFYYLGDTGGNSPWGANMEGSDFIVKLSSIALFTVINVKAMIELNRSVNFNFDHLSLSNDFKDPFPFRPFPEEEKSIFNLWGGAQNVDDVFFRFEEAYLHQLLFNSPKKSDMLKSGKSAQLKSGKPFPRQEKEAGLVVEELVKMMHIDNSESIRETVENELEILRNYPPSVRFCKDSGDLDIVSKAALVREQTILHTSPYLEVGRRLFLLFLPLGLIMMNALSTIMTVSENQANYLMGGYIEDAETMFYVPEGFTYSTSDGDAIQQVEEGFTIFPGELSTVINGYNMNTDCNGWYRELDSSQSNRMFTGDPCESSYPKTINRFAVHCNYTQSTLFVTMLSIWTAYVASFLAFLLYTQWSFKTDDLRFYLAIDRSKSRIHWKVLMWTGYALTIATFIASMVLESMNDWPLSIDFGKVIVFFMLQIKTLSELDSSSYIKFGEESLKDPVDTQFPDKIPLVIHHFSLQSLLNGYGCMAKNGSQLFSDIGGAFLKSLVMGDKLYTTHIIDYDQFEAVLRSIDFGNVIELKPMPTTTSPSPSKEESEKVVSGDAIVAEVSLDEREEVPTQEDDTE